MLGVLEGFTVIAVIIGVGVVIDRTGHLGSQGRTALVALAFYVATPMLLFMLMYEADLEQLFSEQFVATAIGMVAMALLYCVVGGFAKWGAGPTAIGAVSASYVNSGNLGIPIAIYVLGDGSLVAPVMLVQQLIMGPVLLSVLDVVSRDPAKRRLRWWQMLYRPLVNPIVVASLLGLLCNILDLRLPSFVIEPIDMIGAMSVPAVLLAFGMTLRNNSIPLRGGDRAQVLVATILKTFVHPLLAWALGVYVFDLPPATLLAVVVTAALPTAQNIHTFAATYGVAENLARESILLTTVLSVPVIFLVTVLLLP